MECLAATTYPAALQTIGGGYGRRCSVAPWRQVCFLNAKRFSSIRLAAQKQEKGVEMSSPSGPPVANPTSSDSTKDTDLDSESERNADADADADTDTSSEVAKQEEIGRTLQEMRAELNPEKPSFFMGVVEEMGLIDWPSFGKVFGTTLVVLSIIVGSSVVLLTVNVILAKVSDGILSSL